MRSPKILWIAIAILLITMVWLGSSSLMKEVDRNKTNIIGEWYNPELACSDNGIGALGFRIEPDYSMAYYARDAVVSVLKGRYRYFQDGGQFVFTGNSGQEEALDLVWNNGDELLLLMPQDIMPPIRFVRRSAIQECSPPPLATRLDGIR